MARTAYEQVERRTAVCEHGGMTENQDNQPTEELAKLLHRELRSAGSAAKESGATVEEITADLTERLEKLRHLNAIGWSRSTIAEK